jgi:hypothetical protein
MVWKGGGGIGADRSYRNRYQLEELSSVSFNEADKDGEGWGGTECDVVGSCELITETAELAISLTFIAAEWRSVSCRDYTH